MFQNLPNILGNQRHVHIGAIWITEQEPWKVSGWGVKNAHYFTFYRYISIDTYFTLVSMHEEVKTMYFYTNIMQDSRIFGVFQLKLPGRCNFGRSTHTIELPNLVKNHVRYWNTFQYVTSGGGKGICTLGDSRENISFWSSNLKVSLCGSISRYVHRPQQWLNVATYLLYPNIIARLYHIVSIGYQ